MGPPWNGWRCSIDVGAVPLEPGETGEASVSFLSNAGLEAAREAGKFYLWSGRGDRYFGEATVKV